MYHSPALAALAKTTWQISLNFGEKAACSWVISEFIPNIFWDKSLLGDRAKIDPMRRRVQLFLLRRLLYAGQQFGEIRQALHEQSRLLRAFIATAQVRGFLVLILGIIVFGTAGYMIIEGWTAFDSFYMTMITIATVGFGETHPLSNWGRLFTVLLIMLAVTVLAYGLSSSIEYVVTGQLLVHFTKNRHMTIIQDLTNHFIVAGYGRVGQEVALALQQENLPFVVVEPSPENIERAAAAGCLVVQGTATEDENLLQAGIERARGIICATGSDATNVYIVLTARGLNSNLFIISRASDESSEAKLLRAGADRVISPYILSGRRMANLAVRPFVVNFLDVTGSAGVLEKTLEEIMVEEGSIIANRTIGEIDLGSRTGALVLALYRSTGELLTNPRTDTLLEVGTRMIVLGTRDALDVTEALARNFVHLSEGKS